MNIRKTFIKFSILLLVYIVLVCFLQPYGLYIYYTLSSQPDLVPGSIKAVQSALITITFVLNLILAIFVAVDSKQKIVVDWLIVIITFFSAETGIGLFLIWQIYKDLSRQSGG